MGIHAAEVGGVDIAAAHVDAFAEPGFLQEQRQQHGSRREDPQRYRRASTRSAPINRTISGMPLRAAPRVR